MSKRKKKEFTDEEMLDVVMGEIEEFLCKNFRGSPPSASLYVAFRTDQKKRALLKAIEMYRQRSDPPSADWDVTLDLDADARDCVAVFKMKGR